MLRGLIYLWAIISLIGAVGCASTADPPPPDLTSLQENTQTRIDALNVTAQVIEDELQQLDELAEDLGVMVARADDSSAPLSLLRLVAMNCLNSEYDSHSESPDRMGTMDQPLNCQPAHLGRLLESLEEASTATTDDVYELLYVVDQTRILRGSLRRRLAELPMHTEDDRDYIADERATLRQIEADLMQRRGLYSDSGWLEVTSLIVAQRDLLSELNRQIDEITERYPQWPPRLDATISRIYFDLSRMRQTHHTHH